MDEQLQTETIQIKSNKMYRCKKEALVLSRKQVTKDQEGNYFCKSCNQPAEPLEESETGRELLRWL